mgnify:CR=1 FL=1
MGFLKLLWNKREITIAIISIVTIIAHLILRFGMDATPETARIPLYICLVLGGTPLVFELMMKAFRKEFGSDLLAGISIVTAVLLHEHLAGSIVVLMLSGGEALEEYAVQSASSVLKALAKRMPSVAHLKTDGTLKDVPLDDVKIGDHVTIGHLAMLHGCEVGDNSLIGIGAVILNNAKIFTVVRKPIHR